MEEVDLLELIGGEKTVERLVEIFYSKIEKDPLLRPLFPDDLEEGKKWQKLFLIQRFGGKRDYEKQRGHPRLRKRHMPFKIGFKERDRWVQLMKESLDEVGITEKHPARFQLDRYFEIVATKMVNQK
ncbi:MAG: globin [Methanobacteriota archaeon]|nr:MAG: globin [Euryarchaeota archaeon]